VLPTSSASAPGYRLPCRGARRKTRTGDRIAAVTTCLYRVAQESLTTCSTCALRAQCKSGLRCAADGRVSLRITDNGCGMRADDRLKPDSFGLMGMQERVRALGGTLGIDSQPGAGHHHRGGRSIEKSGINALALSKRITHARMRGQDHPSDAERQFGGVGHVEGRSGR